jgi:transcriptional regulator with XRE-family HTH domain
MSSNSPATSFGDRIRQMRLDRALSQFELASRAVISCRHLSFLETGRAQPSESMVSRLATALAVDVESTDALRTAAGFCAHHPAIRNGNVADRILEGGLLIDRAETASRLIEAGQSTLQSFGVTQFFFGELGIRTTRQSAFRWLSLGAFPDNWLRRYDRKQYAMTDPLLVAVHKTDCFFWDDVVDRRSLANPARTMFDEVESVGISSGFVASKRRERSIQIASLMGSNIDSRDPVVRLGLEILASRMLSGLHRMGAFAPRKVSDAVALALPPR